MSNDIERRWLRNDGVVFRMVGNKAERHDDCLGWTRSCFNMDNFENRTNGGVYAFTETFDHLPTELTTLRTFRDDVEAAMQLSDAGATRDAIKAAVEKVRVCK